MDKIQARNLAAKDKGGTSDPVSSSTFFPIIYSARAVSNQNIHSILSSPSVTLKTKPLLYQRP